MTQRHNSEALLRGRDKQIRRGAVALSQNGAACPALQNCSVQYIVRSSSVKCRNKNEDIYIYLFIYRDWDWEKGEECI